MQDAPSTGTVVVRALPGIPRVAPGDDLGALLAAALVAADIELVAGDVMVVAQKIVSKAEGRLVDLIDVEPGPRAREVAARVEKDPRLVELILDESEAVVRARPGLLIVRHRLGLVMANAGIDHSNVEDAGRGERVLLLPRDPDASAARLRDELGRRTGCSPAVIVSDSVGRPWRIGTVGLAIGAAGLPAYEDLRGESDMNGRTLEVSVVGFADQIAAAAGLVLGEAAEGIPCAVVRGLAWDGDALPASAMVRAPETDLFR